MENTIIIDNNTSINYILYPQNHKPITEQQVESYCPSPPSKQNSEGRGLVNKKGLFTQKLHDFGITVFHMD